MRIFRYTVGIALFAIGIYFWPKGESPEPGKELVSSRQETPTKKEPASQPTDTDLASNTGSKRINPVAPPRASETGIERLLKSQLRLTAQSKREFLELSHDDLERVLDHFVDFMLIRSGFEKDLVIEQGVDENGALVLSLAAYPEAGAQLKEMFYADIIEWVGEDGAERIKSALGSVIDVHMKYWGLGAQEIKIWRTNPLQAGDFFYLEHRQTATSENHIPNPLAPFPSLQSSVVSLNDLEQGLHAVYAGPIKRYQSQIRFPPPEPSD